jgi:hypothetical protein
LYFDKNDDRKSKVEYHYADVRRTQTDVLLDPLSLIWITLQNFIGRNDIGVDAVKRVCDFLLNQISPLITENVDQTFTLKIQNLIEQMNVEKRKSARELSFIDAVGVTEIFDKIERELSHAIENQSKLQNNTLEIINQTIREFRSQNHLIPYYENLLAFIRYKSLQITNETRTNIQMSQDLLFHIANMYLSHGALLMDFYSIMKMIMVMENSRNDQMLFVYCGDKHIQNYLEFFRTIFEVKFSQSMNQNMDRCIHNLQLNNIFPYISSPERHKGGQDETILQFIHKFWTDKEQEIIKDIFENRMDVVDDDEVFAMIVEGEIIEELETKRKKLDEEIEGGEQIQTQGEEPIVQRKKKEKRN